MKPVKSFVVAGCACFLIAFCLLGLEQARIVPFTQLYSLAIVFTFIVAGFLMMLAFSRRRRVQ